jgi:hypothetical protein
VNPIFAICLILWAFLAWITHIIVCFKTASWGFLIAGSIFFPVAWIHGTGLWLGIF